MEHTLNAAPRRLSAAGLSRLKAVLFVACLLPLVRTLAVVSAGLEVNPIEFITRSTGTWTLVALLATLALTPLRRLSGWAWPLRVRRMLGLYAFFYGCLHLSTYLWLDQFFDWGAIIHDIMKRPFVTVGMVAFLLMTPLALTSTDGWMRRLGRRWGRLHRLVYPLALLAVVHYWWLVKADVSQPLYYAAVLAALLGWRVWWRWSGR